MLTYCIGSSRNWFLSLKSLRKIHFAGEEVVFRRFFCLWSGSRELSRQFPVSFVQFRIS